MLSAKAAIQHSSVPCVLSLTAPPMPIPSHVHPWALFGTDVPTPDTSGQSMGLAEAAWLQKPCTSPFPAWESSFPLPDLTITPAVLGAETSGAVRKSQSKPC